MVLANISWRFNFPPLQSSSSSTFTIFISLRHLFYWFLFGNEWLRLLYLIQWLIYASHLLNIMVYQQRIEIQGETLIRCKKTEEVPQFLKFNATSSFRVSSFSLSLLLLQNSKTLISLESIWNFVRRAKRWEGFWNQATRSLRNKNEYWK